MYGHMSVAALESLRDTLMASLTARLTGPSAAEGSGRSVQYQQRPDEIRKEIRAVNAELARRAGTVARGPIYLAG